MRSPTVAALCTVAVLASSGFTAVAAPPPSPHRAPAASYAAALSQPKEDPYYPAKSDPRFDALHYQLNLRWNPATATLTGVADITFRAARTTKTLKLDLGAPLKLSAVELDGRMIESLHTGNHLDLSTGPLVKGSRHVLTISYAGTPRPARAPTTRADIPDVGWTTTRSGSVWTMQEPYGAFTWYPVNDHPSDKAYYDARIVVPRKDVGIFNGKLVRRTHRDGHTITTWHLGSPTASYLTTIVIGDYVHRSATGPHGLPITYWVPAGHLNLVKPLRAMPSLIRWLEYKLGPYPFHRIGAVVVPSDSAMETQTLLTLGRGTYRRPDFRSVILHELAHQWYGDTVTPNNWKDLWLNESFATYVEVEWDTQHGGVPWSHWVSYWKSNDQLWRHQDGPPGAYDKSEFGDICVYYCGALMLRELRGKVGARRFDAALRAWVQQHRNANADRTTYIRWLNSFTGRHLGPWIRHWLAARTSPVGH